MIIKITWIGQAGYIIESKGKRLVIDPYLSDSLAPKGVSRMIPVPLKMEELSPHYIFCSHDHGDHFDEETMGIINQLYPKCIVAGPKSVIEHATQMNFDKDLLLELNAGETITLHPFILHGVKAFHSDEFAIGAIIEAGDINIYFSGDSLFNEELVRAITAYPKNIDVMLVCINGKLNNMPWQNSLKLVNAVKPSVAIPMHYGMFKENTEDPVPFIHAVKAAGYESVALEVGMEYDLNDLLN